SALAQNGLNPDSAPAYGGITLAQGFLPDPASVPMTVLGTVDVAAALGTRCRGLAAGYTAATPHYQVAYTGPGGPLRFFFVGREDAVLVVQHLHPGESTRKGRWTCDDDSGGRQHPMITLTPADVGYYNIWVGSAAPGRTISGSLFVTASRAETPERYVDSLRALLPPGSPELLPGLALAPGRAPLYGEGLIQPATGLEPGPVTLRAGGRAILSTAQRQACVTQDGEADAASGYFTLQTAPDYSVTVDPRTATGETVAGTILRLFFVAEAGDTTLAVTDGRGNWACDDDAAAIAGTLNPALSFTVTEPTTFYIWVGAYNPGEYVAGQLYATTRTDLAGVMAARLAAPTAPATQDGQGGGGTVVVVPGGGNPDLLALDAPPTAGVITLGGGLLPDPYRLRTAVAGEVSTAAALGGLCLGEADGYLSAAPTFTLSYTAQGAALLRLFFLAADDAVLAVRAPDGRWYCDDDSGGDLDPLIDILNPPGGTYSVWLGGYDIGNYVSGTLVLTGQRAITPDSQR
ncbi:MAG: hypothetical protein JXN59_14345, partial [Anaerolineae bacterium]|nr:hypothetical protein [Anaerolineae bacterium]